MPIYTRSGDDGTTTTYGGTRKFKSDPLFYAIGAIDELTSFIGLTAVKITKNKDKDFFTNIQKNLYKIMAYLSGAKVSLDFLNNEVLIFEKKIEELDKKLPKLNRFILPGGTEISSWFHIIRAICRRAERNVVKLLDNNKTMRSAFAEASADKQCNNMIRYLNRLSDLFFVMARIYGKNKEIVL
jgi:cob(I)alamin adenosyltransferase